MARVKNLNEFHKAVVSVKKAAHEMRKELDRYRAWYDSKDVYYKSSRNGQKWAQHLFEVNQLVESIEALEMVGRKFNISYGQLVLNNSMPQRGRTHDEE